MGSVAIIGGGISGAACARLLKTAGHDVVLYEKGDKAGGLVKCTRENENLFHRVGGHVFNSKDKLVSEWFWSNFNRDEEFTFAARNAAIHLDDRFLGYPIEQHLYQMEPATVGHIVQDLLRLVSNPQSGSRENFYDFLQSRFGQTLCGKYFIPYNSKIWNTDLKTMPVSWLAGKLPMPSVDEIITSSITRSTESEMVHSTFFYPKSGGSQFIIDRLLQDIDVRLNSECRHLVVGKSVEIFNSLYDAIIYTGDIRMIGEMVDDIDPVFSSVSALKSNGTTTVLCSCDANPYSWVYIPNPKIPCHRMIMTGNFAASNNSSEIGSDRTTCTIEFVGMVDEAEIDRALSMLPFKPERIAINFEENSYVIQEDDTRVKVSNVRQRLEASNIWLCGRFAEWEYFNMDAAISSAMSVSREICGRLNR